jgi:hypothetical protein
MQQALKSVSAVPVPVSDYRYNLHSRFFNIIRTGNLQIKLDYAKDAVHKLPVFPAKYCLLNAIISGVVN